MKPARLLRVWVRGDRKKIRVSTAKTKTMHTASAGTHREPGVFYQKPSEKAP